MTTNIEHISHPRLEKRKQEGAHLIENELNLNGRLAVKITKIFGSMGAFWFLVVWMIMWMLFATIGMPYFRHDPYPFTFLLFLSNLVQLWALPVLAVGQQVLSRASDKQAKQTFEDAEALLKIQDEVHKLVKMNIEITRDIRDALQKNSE